jgi:hypothetical protein
MVHLPCDSLETSRLLLKSRQGYFYRHHRDTPTRFGARPKQYDLRGGTEAPAAATLPPARFEALRHDFNHAFVLEQRIDLAQPVGPQFVPVWQQDLEQTSLALSALNHARSFAETSRAGSVVRQINRRNRRMKRFVTAGRRRSVQCSHLRGHFFTAK